MREGTKTEKNEGSSVDNQKNSLKPCCASQGTKFVFSVCLRQKDPIVFGSRVTITDVQRHFDVAERWIYLAFYDQAFFPNELNNIIRAIVDGSILDRFRAE